MLRVGNVAVILRNTDIARILDDTEIAYYMEVQLNGLPFNNSNITLDEIEDFIKAEAVSNEIGGIIGRYADELSAGNLKYHITAGEVFEITQNLEPELHDLFDHKMTKDDHEHFVRILDDILDFRGLSINGILEDVGINAMIPYLLFSPFLIWGIGILCVLCILLICFYHRSRIKNALLFAGIPVALSGLMFLTAGIIVGTYPELLSDTLYRLARLAGGVAYLAVRYGIIFTAAGVLSVTTYFIPVIAKKRKVAKGAV